MVPNMAPNHLKNDVSVTFLDIRHVCKFKSSFKYQNLVTITISTWRVKVIRAISVFYSSIYCRISEVFSKILSVRKTGILGFELSWEKYAFLYWYIPYWYTKSVKFHAVFCLRKILELFAFFGRSKKHNIWYWLTL